MHKTPDSIQVFRFFRKLLYNISRRAGGDGNAGSVIPLRLHARARRGRRCRAAHDATGATPAAATLLDALDSDFVSDLFDHLKIDRIKISTLENFHALCG